MSTCHHIEDFQHSTFNFQRYEKKRFGEEVFPGKKRQERRPEVAQLDYELSRPCGCAANDGTAVCLYQRLHCWASEIDYGISRWSITLCSYELRIPGSYVITIGCSCGIRTGCSYDIRTGCSNDIRTGCSNWTRIGCFNGIMLPYSYNTRLECSRVQ